MYRHIEKDEKKLTDEEIVKALEFCIGEECHCKDCIFHGVCIEDGNDTQLLTNALDLIHRLQEENERMTDTLNQYINGELINAETMEEIISLEKQVDELTAEKEDLYFQNQNLQTYIDNHEPIWKRNTEQAVKDTAKEILKELKNTRFHKGTLTYDFEMALNKIAQKYGVEVE